MGSQNLIDIFKESKEAINRQRLRIEIITLFSLIIILAIFFFIFYFKVKLDASIVLSIVSIAISLLIPVITYILFDTGIEKIRRLSISKIQEYDFFPVDEFFEKVKKSKEIIILDAFIYTLLDTNINTKSKDSNHTKFLNNFKIAIENNATVRIIVLNPNGRFAEKRAEELKDIFGSKDAALKQIKRSYESLESMKSTIFSNTNKEFNNPDEIFKIETIEKELDLAMHKCDEEAYWAFFPVNKPSSKSDQLLVNITTDQGKFLYKRLELYGLHNKPIP